MDSLSPNGNSSLIFGSDSFTQSQVSPEVSETHLQLYKHNQLCYAQPFEAIFIQIMVRQTCKQNTYFQKDIAFVT